MNHSMPSSRVGWRSVALLALLTAATALLAPRPAVAAPPLTAGFVGPDTVVSVVIRPRQILARLADGGEAVSLYAVEAARWSVLQRGSLQHVLRVIETCGFLLRDVEEIGVVGLGSGDVAHLIRFARPVDPALVGDLFRRPLVRDVHGVRTFRVDERALYAVALIDDKSLLVGSVPAVDSLLEPAYAAGPVHDALARMPADADVAGAFSNERLPRDGLPPGSSLVSLEVCEATMRLGRRPQVAGTATFKDATAAAHGAEELAAVLRQGTTAAGGLVETLAQARPGVPDDTMACLRTIVGSLAKSAAAVEIRSEKERLVVSATAPADAGFPGDVAPLLVLPDMVAAAAAARDEPEDEEAEEPAVPTHWRRFDVAAARARRKALQADPVAVRLRNRFPAAAGFDTASFLAIARDSSPPPRDLPDQPLSLLALTGNFFDTAGVIPARDRTLVVRSIRPNEVLQPFTETLGFGYASLIRIEDITGVSCTVKGDAAQGSVTFESDLAAGEVPYRAVRDGDGWRFTGFDLPGWGLTCAFEPDGTRSLRSEDGPSGGEPPPR
ncbi:MAG: hypothetical protein ACKOSQ_07825 [Planctomycetaceae bacterium]